MIDERCSQEAIPYANAPIVEAILEVSIFRTQPVATEELSSLIIDKHKYPKRVELHEASGQITVGPAFSTSATTRPIGYQFGRSDEKVVVHGKIDGLAISRLAPYTTWEDVFAEFKSHWLRYVELIKPDKIQRVAVRYINRFDLPGNRVELADYFRTYPTVSHDIQYDVAGFLMQLQLPLPDIGGQASITQALVPPPSENIVSVLLDITVSKSMESAHEDFEIEHLMQILRNKKNQFFEACMKPTARDLIRETPT